MKLNHKQIILDLRKSNKSPKTLGGGGIWLYLADCLRYLSQTYALNLKNPQNKTICHSEQSTKCKAKNLKNFTKSRIFLIVLMRNFWILRAVALRMTKMDYHENPLDCHAKPKACLAMTNLCTRTRHCEIFARKSKQSILATLELFKNLGLYANLRLDSLIRFYYIVRIYLLTTRGLDTLLYFVSLSMTKWGVLICLWGIAIRNLLMTCDLDYSLRALRFAQNDNNFIFLTSHKEIQMIA